MNLFECNTCKGTYMDRQRDGTVYHHVCPPLPPDDNGVEAERPRKRDENLIQGLEFETTKDGPILHLSGPARRAARMGVLTGICLEGAGVKCLTDAKLDEPAWIAELKKRIEKGYGN